MNDEFVLQALSTIILALAAADGWWQTRKLWRKHNRIAPTLRGSFGLIPYSYVVVSLLATGAATWYGFLALRRLLDFEPIDWSPLVSLGIATCVLFIPRYLGSVWHRVESDPSNDIPETPE